MTFHSSISSSSLLIHPTTRHPWLDFVASSTRVALSHGERETSLICLHTGVVLFHIANSKTATRRARAFASLTGLTIDPR